MNVAALENCKELYELSGWDDTESYWTPDRDWQGKRQWVAMSIHYSPPLKKTAPAYDLGYLLRQLPPGVVVTFTGTTWLAYIEYSEREACDTPEDAACQLAIELIKQKVIAV